MKFQIIDAVTLPMIKENNETAFMHALEQMKKETKIKRIPVCIIHQMCQMWSGSDFYLDEYCRFTNKKLLFGKSKKWPFAE